MESQPHDSDVSTRTLEMLRQNTAPDPDTWRTIEEILRKDAADISFIDREFSKIQTAIVHLVHQRQIIQARVDRNNALFAPIRRLPVEVLQRIFTLCFPLISTDDTKCLPFQVSHVSAHWRFVVSTMPDLWTKIDLGPIHISMDSGEKSCRIFDRFVSLAHDRSGTKPITMSIRGPPVWAKAGIDSVISLFKFRHRWIELSIDIDLLTRVWSHKMVSLPALKRLALSDRLRLHIHFPRAIMTPRVTHLKLFRFLQPIARLGGMAWSQFTHFEALLVSINDVVELLSQMSNLTHAQLTPVGVHDAPGLQIILLPHLKHLTLSSSQTLISAVAKSLTAPNLSRFEVVVPKDSNAPLPVQSLGQTLRDFIDRSSPPITHLGLQHVSAEDIKDAFEGLPTVESLDLSFKDDSDALNLVMDQLVWSTQPDSSSGLGVDVTNLLPNLKTLTIRRKNLNNALPDIIQMISSRSHGHVTSGGHPTPSRLQRVCFRSIDSILSLVQIRQMGVTLDCMHELCAVDEHYLDISTIWPPSPNGGPN